MIMTIMGPKVLGMAMGPWQAEPCWYGAIVALDGMGKMEGGRLVGGRLCGAHIQKAEPVGTLPFVRSLWWLLKALCFMLLAFLLWIANSYELA